ncbi:3-isopropylmalate dehydratase small subunit [Achromobacter aloeverae]|uniref:3-isopropylmalate dehydratase n=1 Tax=Achromobacter aloeverae TaxID=1750518 RepID=A0A4Q1HGF7_9BURK|nr:3-isopropylmalate dehydratase small subunit [Achromobacter aloeverae]RXN86128.1 3-isopropylmalate dehydratase small subunit [Achromobacter aloeverae]
MQPYSTVEGRAAALMRDNVDTDVIIRIERLSTLSRDALGDVVFESLQGTPDYPFTAGDPSPILLAGRNFGCGSSREGAVWALSARGVRCVIAPGFGDIFFNNCFQNGLLPIVLPEEQVHRLAAQAGPGFRVDLQAQRITTPDGASVAFTVDPLRRAALLEGLDDIQQTLLRAADIRQWQARDQADHPWRWPDEEIGVPCTLMRGGTSKGAFFNAEDLPPAGPRRDALLKAVMGSDDLLQIDGLGGSRLVTAKLAIVGKSSRPDADVDYTYGIVPPGRGIVVYTSNCGNISAAVGPYAIAAGLVPAGDGVTEVRIHNTNTRKILIAHVPTRNGRVRVEGDFAIPGVPGQGAEIFMDYRATTGAKTGRVLPTGKPVDEFQLEDGRRLAATLGDVANPCVFLRAADLGLDGSELPDAINANDALLDTLRELRGKAAQRIGLCADWHKAESDSPALPLVVIVAPPAGYADSEGRDVPRDAMDLRARLIFYNKCHESMAGTGSMCTAAMSAIAGTLVHEAAGGGDRHRLRIGHPLGVMEVVVRLAQDGQGAGAEQPRYERLGFGRTARRLIAGTAYVRREAL